MKKLIAILSGIVLFSGSALMAGETANNPKSMMKLEDSGKAPKRQSKALMDWLNKLKNRIERSKAKNNRIVAVASVRGAKAEEQTPLYWKGKAGKQEISAEELKKFEESVELAQQGKPDEAKTGLEGFIAAYPKSPLAADAKETLALLTPVPETTPAPAAPSAPVPAGTPQ